jgi:hypothetical protein
MSKTYKTRPVWVKLRKECPERIEYHDHLDGICNLEDWVANQTTSWWPRKCGYTVSYYGWNNGFFARGAARWLKSEVRIYHGSVRAGLRKDKHNLLKLSREDIEDYDVINPRARNGAQWNS